MSRSHPTRLCPQENQGRRRDRRTKASGSRAKCKVTVLIVSGNKRQSEKHLKRTENCCSIYERI